MELIQRKPLRHRLKPNSVASHLTDAPWAIEPSYLPKLVTIISEEYFETTSDRSSSLYAIADGIAIIPIVGVLMHGFDWFGMSYESIAIKFNAALADPKVKAIALYCDSPGGEVAGCFDLADAIYAARGIKPIGAILDESAYSAAYALASAANVITVPRTGGTGSIGVVAMHTDITGALEQAGLKITTVQYGARKTDLYPTTPMNKDTASRMQGEVDKLGEMFVAMVARNRKMSVEAVRKTEAGTYLGSAGVDVGLADALLPPNDAFNFLREIAR